jgi:hypothetical protein
MANDSGTWDNTTCKDCNDGEGEDFAYWFNAYDFRNETTRGMWVDRVVGIMGPYETSSTSTGRGGDAAAAAAASSSSVVDGAFIDGNRNGWSSSASGQVVEND